MAKKSYLIFLLSIFFLFAGYLAMAPLDRHDWLLENLLTVIFIIALLFSYRSFPLSLTAYTLIFLFLILHEIGAHFTYAKVPYNDFFIHLFQFDVNAFFGFERNHFDRLVHFLYGFFLVYPLYEIFQRGIGLKGFWGYFCAVNVIMSSSMLFELFEWAAAEIFGGDLGVAYLGTQGDVWDAHKDMALASLGALLVMLVLAWFKGKSKSL